VSPLRSPIFDGDRSKGRVRETTRKLCDFHTFSALAIAIDPLSCMQGESYLSRSPPDLDPAQEEVVNSFFNELSMESQQSSSSQNDGRNGLGIELPAQ
jgi:hypothetical protein